MIRFLAAAAFLVSISAHADPLADANALFARKSYPEALQLYTKLANAGNVEAQQHLGEMYWYGEAGTVDEAKAETWFRKAAAKGNAVAIASLEVMKQRGLRRKEITYWVEQYQGEDLKTGQFNCATPRIPAISKQSQDIERVNASIATWQNCYNAYVTNLNAATPLVKRIPADIVKLFNKEEMARASERMALVQDSLAEEARVSSKLVLADLAAWRSATEAYVKEHNEIVGTAPSEERLRDIEARKRNYAPGK
ncbi:tetratricopeptide repeat protein [Massilia sp. Mn16-1_5]|uniref:tetratricopeptide repeat protein n=1 Tax=Massilia sp. Mn16-1_5 TaxID=2079199 RepID=UPI00109E4B34|nr:SEL1-like repeat protein [Massilia sp. Mn16-1_5]